MADGGATRGGPVGDAPVMPADAGRALEAAVGHAVRTPLHSLLGCLELLAMSGLDDDQRRWQEQMVASAEELLAGSDRVSWLVRMMGGHYRAQPARVFLAAFAAEVAAASDQPVSVVVAPDAPAHLDTDLAALHQIVTELLSNAVLHGAPPVVLGVAPAGTRRDAVRISVSDGGTGLGPDDRRALGATVSGTGAADGLGLALVRRLVALVGGALEVVPSHVGSCLAVTLPLAAATAPAPVGQAAAAAAAPSRALHVLLVEDNATNRLLTGRQLARLGHTMVVAATGAEGVRMAGDPDAVPVDVVLMDRHLPDIDGCEAAVRIRETLRDDRTLPIIAITADATLDARDACLAAGMREVLTKPVDLRQLGDALARAATVIDSGVAGEPAEVQVGWVPDAVHAVMARVESDPAAAAELIGTYLGELPGRRLRIQAALRRDEGRSVVAAAESLRTSSESIGARAVAGTCAALAASVDAADLGAARGLLPALLHQCERLGTELLPFADSRRLEEAWNARP